MAFPTSPSNGDEYTNALGTIYKYLTADDKWYIISAPINLNDLAEKDHISLDNVTANQHHTPIILGSSVARLGYAGGATEGLGYVLLNAVNEDCTATFFVDSSIDASEDIIFTFVFRCGTADANLSLTRYVGAQKTDVSEVFAFNVDGGTGFTVNVSANQWGITKYQYTLAAANFDSGDMITMWFRLSEAAREVRVHCVHLQWTWA